MIFNFDIKKLVQRYLPIGLRKPKMLAWVWALFQPIDTLKNYFLAYMEFARLNLRLNGQVFVLENHLNDLYDSSLRRIKIIDNSNRIFYKFSQNENLPFVYPLYLPSLVDFNFSVDFVVKNPFVDSSRAFIKSNVNAFSYPLTYYTYISSTGVEAEIVRIVKKYKIAGKTFVLESI